MHQHQNTPDTSPDNQLQDHYPPTVWSRFRETGMPSVASFAVAVYFLGEALEFRMLTVVGLVTAVMALLAGVIAVVLEYRADVRYDRQQAGTETAS